MSISEFFNKKAKAVVASLALVFGVAGGYAGHEIAQNQFQPKVSDFTLSSVPDTATEKQFISGHIPGVVLNNAAEAEARFVFAQRIDALEEQRFDYDLAVQAQDGSAMALGSRLATDSVAFINDLRLSKDISEKDYANIVNDFNDRVGIDVSAVTGNYTKGVMYQQEAQVASAFGSIFSDEDMTPQQQSAEVGKIMAYGQSRYDTAGLEGGLAGALLGGVLFLPVMRRQRKSGPKVQGPKK